MFSGDFIWLKNTPVHLCSMGFRVCSSPMHWHDIRLCVKGKSRRCSLSWAIWRRRTASQYTVSGLLYTTLLRLCADMAVMATQCSISCCALLTPIQGKTLCCGCSRIIVGGRRGGWRRPQPAWCFLWLVPVQSVPSQAGATTGRSRVGAVTEAWRAPWR